MGWSTNLFCAITFNRRTYNSILEVLNRIKELEDSIKAAKDVLKTLVVMTEPQKLCPSDEDYPLAWLSNEFESNISIIEEYSQELYKLYLLKENWDNCYNKEGLAINPPSNITWETAFLEGDFIKSKNNSDDN